MLNESAARRKQMDDDRKKRLADKEAKDREKAQRKAQALAEEQARLAGLNHTAIAEQLDAILEGAVGGSVLESTEELPVRVRLPGKQRASLGEIESLDLLPRPDLAANDDASVPLSALGCETGRGDHQPGRARQQGGGGAHGAV